MPAANDLDRSIDDYRATRAEQLRGALRSLLGSSLPPKQLRPEIEYALLHHSVLEIKRRFERGDARAALDVAGYWAGHSPPRTVPTPVGELMICWYDALAGDPDDGEDSIRLVRPGDGSIPDPGHFDLIADALASIATCGYQDVVVSGVGVLVLMQRRALTETNRSWTSRVAPCTIYTDYGTVGSIFGAEIVHEATHSWLNDCLAALGVELPSEARYWSPWKQQRRSAFGMLHATLAFSRVHNYLRALLDRGLLDADERLRQYCLARVAAEGERLASAEDEAVAALEHITDPRLRDVFVEELARLAHSA